MVPALGGRERRVAFLEGDVFANAYFLPRLAWSPCGRFLAYGERLCHEVPSRIVRLCLETLKKDRLTSPPPDCMGDYAPEYSPSGDEIVFVRMGSDVWGNQDLWIHRLGTGQSRQLTRQGYSENFQPVWADSSSKRMAHRCGSR